MQELNKLGYYTCDNKIFRSKMKALIHGNAFNKPVKWVFNDNVFDYCNWTIEPEQTLQELYYKRARELREKYDYIIISFSGGADSNNVVESFLRQGLHIDEIVSNWTLDVNEKFLDLSGNDKSPANTNAEYKLHTIHRLEEIRLRSPLTKITVNDTSKHLLNSFMLKDDPTWVEDRNDVVNVTGVQNYNMLYHSHIRKTLDKNLKIAFILGIDKPKLKIRNNKLYIYFLDKTVNIVTVNEHLMDYTNTSVELFYWDPSCVDMLRKQAHVMRKIISYNPSLKQIWIGENFQLQRTLGESTLKNNIYQTWNPTWFQVNKTTGDWFAELDEWFTIGMQDTREYHNWKLGLEYLAPKISNFILRDHGKIRGTVFFQTKDYYVGEV